MVGWHHRHNRQESEQTPGDTEGQGSLACCSPWGRKESDTTEQLSNKDCTTRARERPREPIVEDGKLRLGRVSSGVGRGLQVGPGGSGVGAGAPLGERRLEGTMNVSGDVRCRAQMGW